MRARFSAFFLLPLAFAVLSCGGHISSTAPAPSIDGNWHIAGAFGVSQFPLFALAMKMSGNTIYANGDIGVNCSPGNSSVNAAIRGYMSLTGQVASDGSFQLSNSASPTDTMQVTVRGTLPSSGSTTWNGHFTLANAASQTDCLFNVSQDFAATLYTPLAGTYTGTITNPQPLSGVDISIKVVQGAPTITTETPLSKPEVILPITGSVTMGSSSCYAAGSASAAASSNLAGDAFNLTFPMSDGSTLILQGWFTDATESTLQVTAKRVTAVGSCSTFAGVGVLTRQS